MATAATISGRKPQPGDADTTLIQWALANGQAGDAAGFESFADRSVQVVGTFGAGGNVVLEGSLDGVNYATLSDPQGNELAFSSSRIETVLEATPYVRPRVTAGDGATAVTILLFVRR